MSDAYPVRKFKCAFGSLLICKLAAIVLLAKYGTSPMDPTISSIVSTMLTAKTAARRLLAFHQGHTSSASPPTEIAYTACGPVRGVVDGEITSWKGIPFAEPPIHSLRWREPKPTCWKGIFDAYTFSSSCPQRFGNDIIGDEDCLYLNVYLRRAPSGAILHQDVHLLPVMVYIHGGSLVTGDGTTDFTHFMTHGCTEGCVAVTIQYRLDVLGWLASSHLSDEQSGASGNYGLMDQQMALKWVRQNIVGFGGDKSRVTVSGQSSGGTSIFALMASPGSVGLFHRAISLSGSPNVTMSLRRAEKQNANITAGCVGTSSQILACMRNASATALLNSRPPCWVNPVQDELPTTAKAWHTRSTECGVVVVDGRVVTLPVRQALALGLVDVPFLVGNMGWESAPHGRLPHMSRSQWSSYLSEAFKVFGTKVGHRVDAEFTDDAAVATEKAYRAITTTYGLTCAAIDLARVAITGHYANPIYIYVNNWSPGAWRPSMSIPKWAFHTWDLTAALETWPEFYTPSAGDLAHTRFLQNAWYHLMMHGTLVPQDNYGWVPVNSTADWPVSFRTMVMADPSVGGPFMVTSYKGGPCALFGRVGLGQAYWWVN